VVPLSSTNAAQTRRRLLNPEWSARFSLTD
jgi:hypothetical protein